MKKLKVKCKTCGDIELERGIFYTDTNEEDIIYPVAFAPHITTLCREYKKYEGGSYEENTGNKPSKDFIQKMMSISHQCIEDKDWEKHTIKPIKMWRINL